MEAIYFPFTYVSKTTAEVLSTCFSTLVIYQETHYEGETTHGIKIRVPVAEDGGKLRKAIGEYKAWAQLHQGNDLAFLKSRTDEIPFYSETSISNIRSEIKNRLKNTESSLQSQSPSPQDSLFGTRLFLALAHEHDAVQAQVTEDFEALKNKEEKLFSDLTGTGEDADAQTLLFQSNMQPGPKTSPPGVPAMEEGLLDRRIRSWAQLFLKAPGRGCVFVTTNPDVTNTFIASGLLDKDPLLVMNNIPVEKENNTALDQWKQALVLQLDALAHTEKPHGFNSRPTPPHAATEKKASLTVYMAANTSPNHFFTNLVSPNTVKNGEEKDGTCLHTLVCLLS